MNRHNPYGEHVRQGGLYYPFFHQRELLKRLYIACKSLNSEFLVTQHSSKIAYVAAGFTDLFLCGESWNMHFKKSALAKDLRTKLDAYIPDYSEIPDHVYEMELNTKVKGMNLELIPQVSRPVFNKALMDENPEIHQEYSEILIAMAFLHNFKLWPASLMTATLEQYLAVQGKYEWFRTAGHVKDITQSGLIKSSDLNAMKSCIYLLDGKALLLLVNPTEGPLDGTVCFTSKAAKQQTVWNSKAKSLVDFDGAENRLSVSLQKKSFLLLELQLQ